MEIKVGKRLYHCIFGWCKVTHPVNNEKKTLVDLEADEISYYEMGKGYSVYKRDIQTGIHYLYTSIEDLFESDQNLPKDCLLKQAALNPTLIFWNDPKTK